MKRTALVLAGAALVLGGGTLVMTQAFAAGPSTLTQQVDSPNDQPATHDANDDRVAPRPSTAATHDANDDRVNPGAHDANDDRVNPGAHDANDDRVNPGAHDANEDRTADDSGRHGGNSGHGGGTDSAHDRSERGGK
jgi:hypothetical protein